jgi:hypothetical protein
MLLPLSLQLPFAAVVALRYRSNEHPKINPNPCRIFHPQRYGCSSTTLTTHNTTFSPQKHHNKTTLFPKYPCKNPENPTQKKTAPYTQKRTN